MCCCTVYVLLSSFTQQIHCPARTRRFVGNKIQLHPPFGTFYKKGKIPACVGRARKGAIVAEECPSFTRSQRWLQRWHESKASGTGTSVRPESTVLHCATATRGFRRGAHLLAGAGRPRICYRASAARATHHAARSRGAPHQCRRWRGASGAMAHAQADYQRRRTHLTAPAV